MLAIIGEKQLPLCILGQNYELFFVWYIGEKGNSVIFVGRHRFPPGHANVGGANLCYSLSPIVVPGTAFIEIE